jgi:hypothetical protein
MPPGGLESWLRSRGIRPGPVYTLLQVGAFVAVILLLIYVIH